MPDSLKKLRFKTFGTAIALTSWLIAMYVFYWLDSSGTWTAETPHRGKMSVVILATGMGLTFLRGFEPARFNYAHLVYDRPTKVGPFC